MASLTIEPADTGAFYFSRDPVRACISETPTATYGAYNFLLVDDGTNDVLYSGYAPGSLRVELSEILSAASDRYPKEATGAQAIEKVMTETQLQQAFQRMFIGAFDQLETTFYALPGGVGRAKFGRGLRAGYFTPGARCFAMTMRNNGWLLTIPENELEPLYFLATSTEEKNIEIQPRMSANAEADERELQSITGTVNAVGLYALNIEKCRREAWETFGVLANVFDVRVGSLAFRVVLTEAQPAKEAYTLRWLNAFGVMERMVIAGTMTETISAMEDEEDDYLGYSQTLDAMEHCCDRRDVDVIYTLSTDPLGPDRLALLRDLLLSSDIRIYGGNLGETPMRVTAKAEDFARAMRQRTPASVSLRLTLATPDNAFGQFGDTTPSRIHSEEFNEKFN